ncbi:MAG: family 10 glycosylhydrolase [Deltaproteobacteria bacterium]|nr:family 10 glycosylhydrolase [Deltaproteobacteria bacterium]
MNLLPCLALLLSTTAAVAPVPKESLSRGVWIVRDRIEGPSAAGEAVEAARGAGFDTLVVQVRGRGDAYYRSELVPGAEVLPPGFDPLAEVLARSGGARVLAWMNVFYVWEKEGPPQDASHVAKAHPDWLLRSADGRAVAEYTPAERSLSGLEGTYADPASRDYREHFCAVVRELVSKYRVDGVHLDFVRYPGAGFGEGGALAESFKRAWGVEPALIPEELRRPDLGAWLRGETPLADRVLVTAALLWAETRAAQVTELVRAVRGALDSVRPGLELSAAVFPNASAAFLSQGQDWGSWAEEGLVQALFPMAYSGGTERVTAQLEAVRDLVRTRAPAVRLWAGLGAFVKDPASVRAEAAAARELGYDGLCLFDLGSLLAKPAGPGPYAAALEAAPRGAVKGDRSEKRPGLLEPPPDPLRAAVAKALGATRTEGLDVSAALAERRREFEEVRRRVLPRLVAELEGASVAVAPWAEARGVVRYAGGKDGEPLREAQRLAITTARERLLAGDAFEAVVGAVSESGKRGTGGPLGRRYLRPQNRVDRILSELEPGQVSPIVEAPGGFWFFRLERKGAPGTLPWSEAPWPARRLYFREALSRALAPEPGSG